MLEFALAWPVLLLSILAALEIGLWSEEAFAARSAALAGARAGSAAGATPALAARVTASALGPALFGARVAAWCPGAPAPPSDAWVCALDRSTDVEVRVGGSVPALVPLPAARLPLRADVVLPKERFL